ncbi:MAG: histidine triad nucleotide-binding protein [Acidobacteria bacterium]|nr:histidine triad nucleotide-binding protein [Acidobacteriota bacterium]
MAHVLCIFCKILAGEAPARIIYEDESCIAFQDINPQAPVHVLVIPRKHYASAEEAEEAEEPVLGHLHRVAAQLARQFQITDGYRVVMNTGAGAGQSVFHVHLHLLGGRLFRWPPG